MNIEKAIFLNKYLTTCIQAFNEVLLQEPLEEYEIDGELVNFDLSDFEKHYNDLLVMSEDGKQVSNSTVVTVV